MNYVKLIQLFAFYGYVEHGLTLPSYLSKSFMGWADTIKTRQLYSSCKIAFKSAT